MKKNWNVAKIFTLLITVLFLASTLFVGCKEQEPEPGPEPDPSPVMYTVTYAVEGGGKISVTGIPEPKTVEKGTVLKVDDLPTLTEPEGWTFKCWYIGEEPFTSDYTVTSNIIITAKFVENVAPSFPEDPVDPDTTNNFNGNYYAGKYGDTDFGYIEFTTETECVVCVVSEVSATYTVADNVATIKGEKVSDEEDAIEIKTTALANDSFSVTYPVEICQKFNPDASENMVITYTKADKPSSEGGEGGVESDPEIPETPADPEDPSDPETPETPADPEDPTDPEDPVVPDTTNNFERNYYAGKYGDTDFGYIEFTTETECVVCVEIDVPATYTVADNVATIKGVKVSDEEDYSEIEIKTTTLANDSFSITYPVEICQKFDPAASEDMVITYTKVDNPSSEGGEGVVVPDPVVTYTVEGIDANLVTGLPKTGSVNKDIVLNLSPLEAPEGYVFDGWYINDECVSQHTVDADVTIVAKFSAIVPVGTTYTIPDINAEWTNIVVYVWSEDVDPVILQATNDAGIVSFQSTVEYEKAIVVKINDSVDTNDVVIDVVSEFHVWSATVKVDQTGNLELGENNIYELPPIVSKEVYLNPGVWDADSAWFAVNYWGDNGSGWIKMVLEDKYYKCEIPEGSNIIFCRMDPSKSDLSWDSKWNQSEDLILSNDNLYSISGWGGEKSTGSWSTKE